MKGCDLVNTFLPDELIMEIFRHVEAKSDRDACSLVCRKWRRLERACRRTIRIGASGTADQLVDLVVVRFTGLRNVFIDERLPVTTVQPQRSPPSKTNLYKLWVRIVIHWNNWLCTASRDLPTGNYLYFPTSPPCPS
ncbi:hypothetical protein BHE74_00040067 [Ensete ventricosum]|nr:hypothetical protein GW17_00031695 [Ensete ventricosum]RWW53445.1 hypothetical protein BHE74_00040067 [Ensete ventricosum]